MTQLIGLKSFHDTHKSQHNLPVVTLNAQLEANQCSQEKTKRLRWPPASGFFFTGFNRPERGRTCPCVIKIIPSFKLGVRTKSSINRAGVLRVRQQVSIVLSGRITLHVLKKLE